MCSYNITICMSSFDINQLSNLLEQQLILENPEFDPGVFNSYSDMEKELYVQQLEWELKDYKDELKKAFSKEQVELIIYSTIQDRVDKMQKGQLNIQQKYKQPSKRSFNLNDEFDRMGL